jgi:hypothetical protein
MTNTAQQMTAEQAEDLQHEANEPQVSDAWKFHVRQAEKFGTKSGDGKKSHVQWGRDLVEGGKNGDLKAVARGPIGDSHAYKLYQVFAAADAAAADETLSDGDKAKSDKSLKAQVSKAAAFIRLGQNCPTYALELFDRARTAHRKLAKNAAFDERLKYRSTYTAINSIAIAQSKLQAQAIKNKTTAPMMDDLSIQALMLKPPKKVGDKTGADILIEALASCERATRGTDDREAIEHDDLPMVINMLRQIIIDVEPEKLEAYDTAKQVAANKKAAAAAAREKAEADKLAKKLKDAEDKRLAALVSDDPDAPEDDTQDDETEGDHEDNEATED